jgi:hypothetical protein
MDWVKKTLLATFYHLELVQQYLEHAFTNYTHFYICCHLCMSLKEYWVHVSTNQKSCQIIIKTTLFIIYAYVVPF